MAGIFGGHIFQGQGLGQTTAAEDVRFRELISSLTGSGSSISAPVPGVTSPATPSGVVPTPARSNTMLYALGGVAVLGLLTAAYMAGGRRVSANRRRRRR